MFDPKSCTASTQTTVDHCRRRKLEACCQKTSSPQWEDRKHVQSCGQGKDSIQRKALSQGKGKGKGGLSQMESPTEGKEMRIETAF